MKNYWFDMYDQNGQRLNSFKTMKEATKWANTQTVYSKDELLAMTLVKNYVGKIMPPEFESAFENIGELFT